LNKKISYIFKTDQDLINFINKEVKKYVGKYNTNQILYSYNRMTIEELSQEVFLKLLRTVQEDGLMNKSYVRRAVMMVCIDEYRRTTDSDQVFDVYSTDSDEGNTYSPADELLITQEEVYQDVERMLSLDIFEPKELKVMLKLMEGLRNPEVREELGIPKMTYYTLLNKLKLKYTGTLED